MRFELKRGTGILLMSAVGGGSNGSVPVIIIYNDGGSSVLVAGGTLITVSGVSASRVTQPKARACATSPAR